MGLFSHYALERFHDEMFEAPGTPRPHYRRLYEALRKMPPASFRERNETLEAAMLRQGITFTLASQDGNLERTLPFDPVPRILAAKEWEALERGLVQRVKALNAFLLDVYGAGKILADGVIPRERVLKSPGYRPQAKGLRPPRDVCIHVAGIDLVRDEAGTFRVLEDNVRTPSGVSYVLKNRELMKKLFPQFFHDHKVRPVDIYPQWLLETLRSLAPDPQAATVAVLTPGLYNSAFFEHSFLAKMMGVELCEGRDLFVRDDAVWMRTTRGPVRVDVIYRRVDDDFLDPEVFRPDSQLGIPGILRAYRKGRVVIANAVGNGVADDKAVYPYVPDMIRYYLGEDPVLPNVPTYVCARPEDLKEVLERLPELVVKRTDGSGGYGMLVGPHATRAELAAFRKSLRKNPRDYIAQPTLALSRHPTYVGARGFEGRHVDLRPYVLYGENVRVIPGGLTRVALRKGSLVVNSSQGGGSKDTWVL